ncbi:hypothetical protein THAOC_13954, partial [Thalassiosira oceanica]
GRRRRGSSHFDPAPRQVPFVPLGHMQHGVRRWMQGEFSLGMLLEEMSSPSI